MKGMKLFLCLFAWLVITQSITLSKISTLYATVLTPVDYLLSTLGLFRISLNPQWCQLRVQTFNSNDYTLVGYYPRNSLPPCQSLSIVNNSLVSNNNDVILSLRTEQLKTTFDQVYATVDQMGIIRLNGVYFKQFQSSENWISIFRWPLQFVFSITNLSVTLYNSLSFIQNNGNWGFSATNGQLRIFRVDDASKIARFNYTAFTLTPNNLFDYNSNSIPFADFKFAKYQQRCSNNDFLSFQGPFTFAVNPYWPELRLLDQKGYEIVNIRYPSPNCPRDVGVDFVRDTDDCLSWFCPQNMFQLLGNCLTQCPSPYFNQIGRNGINRCVLNCQVGLQKDLIKRICSCKVYNTIACPSTLKSTPLGCICSDGLFFSSTNKAINDSACVKNCGPYYIGHKDGICIPCPKYCLFCQFSNNSYHYLNCNECESGFIANDQGYCVKSCENTYTNITQNPGLGLIKTIGCLPCSVTYCQSCPNSVVLCKICTKPYTLHQNSCLSQCPKGYKIYFDKSEGFRCLSINDCGNKNISLNTVNNQSNCFCSKNTGSGYIKGCGQFSSIQQCKLDQYYDSTTMQCLLCPLGCLTCLLDINYRIQCTSCRPAYSLFVTLAKNSYCQRNSLLSICPNSYNKTTQICSINMLNSAVITNSNRNLCLQNIKHCSICLTGSLKNCSLCSAEYYLFQGLCISECPKGSYHYRHQRVCLPASLNNCLSQRTQNQYWIFNKNSANQYSDAFYFMLTVNFQTGDPLNDPLGAIFTYSQHSSNKIVGDRMVNIAISYQKCLICEKGYGITPSGGCGKCNYPCIQCGYVSDFQSDRANYCLRCDQFHKLSGRNICEQLNLTEMPCVVGEYRNQSSICQQDCLSYFFPDYSTYKSIKDKTINCSHNCPNHYQIVPFQTQQNTTRLQCTKQPNSDISTSTITFLGNRVSLANSQMYMLVSSNQLKYSSNTPFDISVMSSDKRRRLLSQINSNSLQIYSTSFGIIIIDKQNILANSALLISLHPASITSSWKGSQIYLGNSLYGFQQNSPSFIDLIYNQTSNLFMYGRACIVIAFILTIVFLARQMNYKTDNLFITFAVVYLILPSLNLQPNSSALNSYSFLYGFAWGSFLQLFSNPRILTKQSLWFTDYLQKTNNNAHYLLFVDNNIMRNCWSILLVLIVVIALLGTILLMMRLCSVKKQGYLSRPLYLLDLLARCSKNGYQQQDINHMQSVSYLLVFFVEHSFIGLIYYSLNTVLNSSWQLASSDSRNKFIATSAVFMTIIVVYSIARFNANRIGGIYCFKRIALGLALGLVSILGGIDQNIVVSLILLLSIQLSFWLLRMRYELRILPIFPNKQLPQQGKIKIKTRHTIAQRPTCKQLKQKQLPFQKIRADQSKASYRSQFWIMLVEEILIMIAYVFLVLINNLKQVSALVVWIILNVFMVNFGVQFFDLAVEYWHNAYNKDHHRSQPFYRRIRTIWDHDLSQKTLAQTTDL